MNVTFRANDLQALISQPQKFSQDGATSTKPVETTPNTEEKPNKHGSTGKGFFWGAIVTLAAAIMIAGKGSPAKGFKLLLGGFEKLAKKSMDESIKLKDEAIAESIKLKDEAIAEANKLKDEAVKELNKLKNVGKRFSKKVKVENKDTKKSTSYIVQQKAKMRAKRAEKAAKRK
ncbi:MAG TPA: hypothetical protein PLG15_06825 [Candidatus Gastranaerophilaceae bacterium]|nr:hypothetical protein [Candidatus Gastranaerophilaceae bacterium]HPT42080.1 hypothetical protein [Candidatus Gastranaerophilaceae bacterium]